MKLPIALLFLSLVSGSLASAQSTGTLANLSSRGQVGPNAGSLVAGFVVQGTAPKAILIRGVGPGLGLFGVGNPSAAVAINLYDSTGNLIATKNGFQDDPDSETITQTAASVGAFPLTAGPGDTAMLATLAPGGYTIEIVPNESNPTDGDALLEIYDADAPGATSKIANLSSRGHVGASAGSLIAGFVITGDAPKSMLIRGIGPDLAQFGISDAAGDVRLNVYNSNGELIASNTGFQTDPAADKTVQTSAGVGAFPLTNPGNSAMLVTLPPGGYTVEVAAADPDAADGVALVEVYDADGINPSSTDE